MFVKLLKYEWRASRGLVGLMCAIIVIAGLVTGGTLRYMIWSAATGNDMMVSLYTIVLTVAVMAIAGSCVMVMYLLVYRFYKSRFRDQGYLVMTLPVTTHENLLASIVNTIICILLVGLTAVVSTAAALGIFLNVFDQTTRAELLRNITDVGERLAVLGVSMDVLLLRIPGSLISGLADIILLMLAVTVTTHAYKHPVLRGAVVYIGTDILVYEGLEMLGHLIDSQALLAVIQGLVYTALALIAYFVMHFIIDKKLNLT